MIKFKFFKKNYKDEIDDQIPDPNDLNDNLEQPENENPVHLKNKDEIEDIESSDENNILDKNNEHNDDIKTKKEVSNDKADVLQKEQKSDNNNKSNVSQSEYIKDERQQNETIISNSSEENFDGSPEISGKKKNIISDNRQFSKTNWNDFIAKKDKIQKEMIDQIDTLNKCTNCKKIFKEREEKILSDQKVDKSEAVKKTYTGIIWNPQQLRIISEKVRERIFPKACKEHIALQEKLAGNYITLHVYDDILNSELSRNFEFN